MSSQQNENTKLRDSKDIKWHTKNTQSRKDRKEKRNKLRRKQKANTRIRERSSSTETVILNVNGSNTPVKSQRRETEFFKKDSTQVCVMMHFKQKGTYRVNVKKWKITFTMKKT